MAKSKVKDAPGADIEVWIVEEGTLHVLLVELTVDLCPGPLYRAVRVGWKKRREKHSPRRQHPLSGSGRETECRPRLKMSIYGTRTWNEICESFCN